MNIDEIRKISLVEFLNQLGYQPPGRFIVGTTLCLCKEPL